MFTDNEYLLQRLAIMIRQSGNVSGSLSFYLRTPDKETEKKQAHKDHLKCDLADLLNQVLKLADDLKLDRSELIALGDQRYHECFKEFQSKGKSQYFI